MEYLQTGYQNKEEELHKLKEKYDNLDLRHTKLLQSKSELVKRLDEM